MDGRVRLPPVRVAPEEEDAGGVGDASPAVVGYAVSGDAHDEAPEVAAPANVTEDPRGVWLYAAVAFAGAPLAMLVLGIVTAVLMARGYPTSQEKAETTEAALWRIGGVFVYAPAAAVIYVMPFAFTYRLGVQMQARLWLVVFMVAALSYGLFIFYLGADRLLSAQACRIAATVLSFPVTLLPVWLLRGAEKRGAASGEPPVMMRAVLGILLLILVFRVVRETLSDATRTALLLFWALALSAMSFALYRDRPESVILNEWYTASLVTVAIFLPLLTNSIVVTLLNNLDQADPLQSFATVALLSLFLWMAYNSQYAFARRAFAPRFRSLALFPIQVFEDMYSEFFFVESGVYSSGFFVLLALQMVRTMGRDTGLFDEIMRVTGNMWRRWRGEPQVARAGDAVVEWARIWQQNMVSELSAMFFFIGTIVAENAFDLEEIGATGLMVGQLTALDNGERSRLLGGYGVVLAAELMAHVVVYATLRWALVKEQARMAASLSTGGADGSSGADDARKRSTIAAVATGMVSLSAEAGRLIRTHGVFMLATLVSVGYLVPFHIRRSRLSYDAI